MDSLVTARPAVAPEFNFFKIMYNKFDKKLVDFIKKFFKKIMILLAVLPNFFMASCFGASSDKTARLELKNALVISQNYIVGEDVKLNGQMFDYYKSINDSSATESNVLVTSDMLDGFSTAKIGDYTFTIKYKNATSEGFTYHVYDEPTLANFEGKYSCLQFVKKTLVELETDKVNILTYNTSADIINDTPTKQSTNFTIGVYNNGLPKIEFTWQGENYCFYNFGTDGKAKTLAKKSNDSYQAMTCTYVKSLEFVDLNKQYTGTISSGNLKDYVVNLTVTESTISATLTNNEDVKTLNFESYDFSFGSNTIFSASGDSNKLRISVMSKNQIKVISSSDDSTLSFRVDCSINN